MEQRRSIFLTPLPTLLVVILILGIGGCGRGREGGTIEITPAESTDVGPTATSSAILAATPTEREPTPAENREATAPDSTTQSPDPEPTVASNGSGEAASNKDDADSVDAPTDGEPACSQEIALDLAGHPHYTMLSTQLGCPQSSASTEPVAINEFGPGPEYDRFMLWFSTDSHIYVMKPDRTWQAFPDSWQAEEPEIQCNPLGVEETSPPLPRRGFGKLWCSDAALQDVMGSIPREERLCQHTVVQHFEKGQLLGCFEDATIRYFQIFNDGSWDMVLVQ